jgi:preprotein translocase subunit SecF
MNIIGKKYIYFAISLIVMIPGLIALCLWGLKLSIDFTGGSKLSYQIPNEKVQNVTTQIRSISGLVGATIIDNIQSTDKDTYSFKTKTLSSAQHQNMAKLIIARFPAGREVSYETVGPVIGGETTANAFKAVIIASILIVIYIAFSFRNVPKPASSWRFGICTVAALLHDVIVVVGIFSLLGHFFNVEIDSLFITAVLTVIGFSVHDTIVVFDRIRENLRKMGGVPFESVVNESIVQTLGRSLNTSFTVLLVLFALVLFGGESIKWFVAALLIGILSGTYSSIFNAAPLLVFWEEWRRKRHETRR